MKDIVITAQARKREIFIALVCFALAFGLNVYAIIKYARPASELISQIGFVFAIAIVFYLLLWLFRLLYYAVKNLIIRS